MDPTGSDGTLLEHDTDDDEELIDEDKDDDEKEDDDDDDGCKADMRSSMVITLDGSDAIFPSFIFCLEKMIIVKKKKKSKTLFLPENL
jgi:hypothetical protein